MNRSCRLELANDMASVTVGRHYVRKVLLEWGCPALVEDAELGVSELVANAVRHARTDLVLSLSDGDDVVIAIEDGQPELRHPVAGDDGLLAERGRGLHIVAAISYDWGIRALPGGKVVWFSLRHPDRSRADADVYQMADQREARRQGDTAEAALADPEPGRSSAMAW